MFFVLILLFSASLLVMKGVCNMQPKMRAKFKVSFQSGDKHPSGHSRHSLSDESEGCFLLLPCCFHIAAMLLCCMHGTILVAYVCHFLALRMHT